MSESCKRLAAGVYLFTVNGHTYRLEEVGQGFGVDYRPLWHISTPGQAAFDAARTLREVKDMARVAAQWEGK